MKELTLSLAVPILFATFFCFTQTTHAKEFAIVRRHMASLLSSRSKSSISDVVLQMRSRRVENILDSIDSASRIPAWMSTLGSDGKWPDNEVDYATGCSARRANWPAQEHWNRIQTMAAAWHGSLDDGAWYANDPKLKAAISSAMDYWFGRDFKNPRCLDEGGKDGCPCDNPDNALWNTNWYSNVILIPGFVGRACLLLGDSLDEPQLDKCTQMTSRAFSVFYRAIRPGFVSGANILDIASIGTDLGLLNGNVTLLEDAFREIHDGMTIYNEVKADGIRADGAFGQHSGVLYNGNYGKDYINAILDIELVAAGTEYAASSDSRQALGVLFDAGRWMIFKNTLSGVLHWDFSVLGRFISFPVIDKQATSSLKMNIDKIRDLGQLWSSENLTDFANSLSQNSATANAGDLVGNRMFFTNDYMVHRGRNYVTTLKMYSTRTVSSECVNIQNTMGFHLSDGALRTYIYGDEYEDIAAAWDWDLIPGITVDYGGTPLECASTKNTGLGAFVGGVSDGEVGISAMWYTNPSTKSLSWQKAWFFLDDDVQHIMVSGISSTSDSPVLSVLDQRRHSGMVVVDGQETQAFENAPVRTSLWHGDVGYAFPDFGDTAEIKVDVAQKTGDWSKIGTSTQPPATVDIFTASIHHKTLPVPISYTVFPGTTLDGFFSKSRQGRLRTIQNDEDVSAVFDEKYNNAYIVFWNEEGGAVEFTPSEKCAPIIIKSGVNLALIYKLDTGNVTVADPSQLLKTADVAFLLGLGRKPPHWGQGRARVLNFELPSGGIAGSSVTKFIS